MKTSKKHGIVENIGAAMALLNVERHVIREAKQAACPAFLKGSRIDVDVLAEYLAEHKPAEESNNRPPAPPQPLPDLSTIEQSLAGAIEVEAESLAAVRAARAKGDFAAIRELTASHGLAQRNRREAEKAVDKIKIERGQLIHEHLHKAQLFRLWNPIVNQMRAMPRKVSTLLVHVEEVTAERILAKAIENVLTEMHRHMGKSDLEMAEASSENWIEGELRLDPSGAHALAGLEKIRTKALAAIAARQAVAPPATSTSDVTPSNTINQ